MIKSEIYLKVKIKIMDNDYKLEKEKAYKMALRFKQSDLKQEIIYAKLEKLGFAVDIAKEVAFNIAIQHKNRKEVFNYQKFAINTVLVAFCLALLLFVFSGRVKESFYVFFSVIGISFLFNSLTIKN